MKYEDFKVDFCCTMIFILKRYSLYLKQNIPPNKKKTHHHFR